MTAHGIQYAGAVFLFFDAVFFDVLSSVWVGKHGNRNCALLKGIGRWMTIEVEPRGERNAVKSGAILRSVRENSQKTITFIR